MKKVTIILVIVAATLTGCTTVKNTTDEQRDYISWVAFCANRNYNINDNTGEVINEYLDTWRGSVEEEEVFIANGVEPC